MSYSTKYFVAAQRGASHIEYLIGTACETAVVQSTYLGALGYDTAGVIALRNQLCDDCGSDWV